MVTLSRMAGTFLIGIDPGVSGALAFCCCGGKQLLEVFDMPLVDGEKRKRIDGRAIAERITMWRSVAESLGDKRHRVVIEHVQGVQGSGATSAFSFGRSLGVLEGVCQGLLLDIVLVRPQRWTADLCLTRCKTEHRTLASSIWPKRAKEFARVKDDGRADAALLCHWYARHGGAE